MWSWKMIIPITMFNGRWISWFIYLMACILFLSWIVNWTQFLSIWNHPYYDKRSSRKGMNMEWKMLGIYETFPDIMIGAQTKERDRGWSSQTNEMITDTTRLPRQKTMIVLSWQKPSRTLRWCFRLAWDSETRTVLLVKSKMQKPNMSITLLTSCVV